MNFADPRDILRTCRAGAANTGPGTDHMFLLGGNVAPTIIAVPVIAADFLS